MRGEGERQQKQKQAGGEKSSRVWEEEREGEREACSDRRRRSLVKLGGVSRKVREGWEKCTVGTIVLGAGCPATLGTNSNLMSWLLISLLGVSY